MSRLVADHVVGKSVMSRFIIVLFVIDEY